MKAVEISGNQRLPEEELLDMADIPLGGNIFALRSWEIEKDWRGFLK